MRRRWLSFLLVAAVTSVPLVAGAAAPSDFPRFFASGVRLYKAMDFESALEQFQLARAQPHGADDDVQALLYLGILKFELGAEAAASDLFRTALAIDPAARLPVRVSPLIETAFENERKNIARINPGSRAPRPPPAPPAAARAAPPAAVAAPAQPSDASKSRHVAGGVLIGVGGAALVAGAISYGVAWLKYSDYEVGLLTRSEASTIELESQVGVGLAIGGLVVLATGITVFAWPDGSTVGTAIVPTRGGAAFAIQGALP